MVLMNYATDSNVAIRLVRMLEKLLSETKVLRGEACAAHLDLRDQLPVSAGFDLRPSRLGRSLFLKDIWPDAPILSYQEFFLSRPWRHYDFDPEQQGTPGWQDCAYLRMKNANLLLNLQASNHGM